MAGLRQWSCPRCTFLNERTTGSCDMCEGARPSLDPGAANSRSRKKRNSKRTLVSAVQSTAKKAKPASHVDADVSSSSLPIVSITPASKLMLPRRSVPSASHPYGSLADSPSMLDRKPSTPPKRASPGKKTKDVTPPGKDTLAQTYSMKQETAKASNATKASKPRQSRKERKNPNKKSKVAKSTDKMAPEPEAASPDDKTASPKFKKDVKRQFLASMAVSKSSKSPVKAMKQGGKPSEATKAAPKNSKKAVKAAATEVIESTATPSGAASASANDKPIPITGDSGSNVSATNSNGGEESVAPAPREPVVTAVGPGCTDANSGIPKDFFVWGIAKIEERGVDIYSELKRHGWGYRDDVLGSEKAKESCCSSSRFGADRAADGIYVIPAVSSVPTPEIQICYVEGKDFFYSLSEVIEYVHQVIQRTSVVESDVGSLRVERITPESDREELMMIARDGIGSVTGTNYFASKLEQLLDNTVSGKHFIGAIIRDPDSGCIIGMAFGSVAVLKRKKNGQVMEGNIDGLWVAPSNGGAHLGYMFASWFESLVKLTAYSLHIYEGVCEVYTSVRLARGEDLGTFWRKVGYSTGIGGSPLASKVIDLQAFTDDTVFWPESIE